MIDVTKVKNYVTLNILMIWFAFMGGYAIAISNYVAASTAVFALLLALVLKQKQEEELGGFNNGKEERKG